MITQTTNMTELGEVKLDRDVLVYFVLGDANYNPIPLEEASRYVKFE